MNSILKKLINDPECLFVVNHSGGKDSQAMMGVIKKLVPKNRILVLHSTLGEVEWPDTIKHIKNTTKGFDFQCVTHSKGETLLTLVEKKGMWPSPQHRSCTSQLKAAPLDKAIRHELKKRGWTKVVSCMGLRAEESSARSKQPVFRKEEYHSKAGREWYRWLPIHDWSTQEVFGYIRKMKQKPHWAYEAGMSRLSCCFCIMASRSDLATAARLRPKLYRKYLAMERKIGHALIMPTKRGGIKYLDQIIKEFNKKQGVAA